MMLAKKVFRSRMGIAVAFIALFVVFTSASVFLVSKNRKEATRIFNEELELFAKLSTRTIIQNFELYFDSGNFKFEEITEQILNQNDDIRDFEIIDTDGKMLYKSDGYTNGAASPQIIEAARLQEESYTYGNSGQIETVISPYIEEWGAHKLSVKYNISPEKLERNLSLYRNEVALASILLFMMSFLPILIIFSLREMELQREEQKRLKMLNKQKDDFMTLVAHNLRTPITIMKGYTNLAEEQSLKGVEKEYISAISDGADRLNETTETILSVTSLLSGENIRIEKVNLTKIIEESINDYSEKIKQKKIKVVFDKKNVIETNGSAKYLRKAIESYVDNAIKFNKEKGSINIKLRKSSASIDFSISDTGIGIKSEDLTELFSSFHRSVENTLDYDYAGLGMGLYLTKTIIEAHKGTVSAESEYGKGSTFGFSLPI